jgi:hypothetical protein
VGGDTGGRQTDLSPEDVVLLIPVYEVTPVEFNRRVEPSHAGLARLRSCEAVSPLWNETAEGLPLPAVVLAVVMCGKA